MAVQQLTGQAELLARVRRHESFKICRGNAVTRLERPDMAVLKPNCFHGGPNPEPADDFGECLNATIATGGSDDRKHST